MRGKRQDHSHTQPPLPGTKQKQKQTQVERSWVRTNEGNESKRPEKQGKKDFLSNSCESTLPYTNDLSTSLALSHARTHARTTLKSNKKTASIHPFFLDYITQKGIPPRHEREFRARNSRPANQSEREREKYIHFVSAISPSTTSSHLSTPHISTPFSTPRPPTRTTTTTTAIQRLHYAASDPIQFSHPSIQL